jgi:peptidoglycan hydrolase-like protein with peptidoglycan-binding domain
MRFGRAASAASVVALALAGAALELTASVAQAWAPTELQTSPSSPGAPAQAKPAACHIKLVVAGMHGHTPFALTHEGIEVQGTVVPYVAGERVRVSFYRDGHIFGVRMVGVAAHGKGSGTFHVSLASSGSGQVRAIAVHAATPKQAQTFALSEDVTVLSSPYLTIGARGPAVWVLQRSLGVLHYAVPQSGYFDEATADAVTAFRKLTGLARVQYADSSVFRKLKGGEGAFHVRYPHDGRHIEADLTYQVLAEIEPGGRVHNIYPTSSGKPSTPTVLGRFQVYSKTPGTNSHDMLDSNYFISGYAIHGYPEVPSYAASHGCLRVPDLDAPAIYGWTQIGTPVDVYY